MPSAVHSAGTLAEGVIAAEPDPTMRLALAYRRAFARPPSGAEERRALDFLDRYARALESEGVEARRREQESWSALARTLLASNELLFID